MRISKKRIKHSLPGVGKEKRVFVVPRLGLQPVLAGLLGTGLGSAARDGTGSLQLPLPFIPAPVK